MAKAKAYSQDAIATLADLYTNTDLTYAQIADKVDRTTDSVASKIRSMIRKGDITKREDIALAPEMPPQPKVEPKELPPQPPEPANEPKSPEELAQEIFHPEDTSEDTQEDTAEINPENINRNFRVASIAAKYDVDTVAVDYLCSMLDDAPQLADNIDGDTLMDKVDYLTAIYVAQNESCHLSGFKLGFDKEDKFSQTCVCFADDNNTPFLITRGTQAFMGRLSPNLFVNMCKIVANHTKDIVA